MLWKGRAQMSIAEMRGSLLMQGLFLLFMAEMYLNYKNLSISDKKSNVKKAD
jgi:hypothetical protein